MKIWNYVVMVVLILMLMNFSGIDLGNNALLEKFGITRNYSETNTSQIFLYIIAALGVATAAGMVVGFISKNAAENYIVNGIFLVYASVFISGLGLILGAAYKYEPWVFYITSLLISPLIVGFVMSMPEYFRGTDY